MPSYDILEKGQKDFCFQTSFSYYADVKPTYNKQKTVWIYLVNISTSTWACVYYDLYEYLLLEQKQKITWKVKQT